MAMQTYADVPFKVLPLDFAEIKKKDEGIIKTQSFLIAVDGCIELLERGIFKNVKVVVADNGPAFRSDKLRVWAQKKGVELRFPAPYHPEAISLAERVICDLKTFIALYPQFKRGSKCSLEAAVSLHNRSYTAGIGCSPHFAALGTSAWLAADKELDIVGKVSLRERPLSAQHRKKYRCNMKKNMAKMPNITPGDNSGAQRPACKISVHRPFQCAQNGKTTRNIEDCVLPRLERKNGRGFDRKCSSVPSQEG